MLYVVIHQVIFNYQ